MHCYVPVCSGGYEFKCLEHPPDLVNTNPTMFYDESPTRSNQDDFPGPPAPVDPCGLVTPGGAFHFCTAKRGSSATTVSTRLLVCINMSGIFGPPAIIETDRNLWEGNFPCDRALRLSSVPSPECEPKGRSWEGRFSLAAHRILLRAVPVLVIFLRVSSGAPFLALGS